MPASVLALDLGGTKISAAVVAPDGRILHRAKVPVDKTSVAASLDQIAGLARAVAATFPVEAAGLIVPGIYSPGTGRAWAPNLWGWEEIPLRDELAARLAFPVTLDSDRAGCVLGEQWLGAARGCSDVVFVAIGTGIGAGILSGGRLLRGAHDIAGAVGWFALNPQPGEADPHCGCWESHSAGPGLARRAGLATAEAVVEAARRSDPRALAAVAEAASYTAMGLANLISLLNPEVIVLGGGLMQAADLFLDTLRAETRHWAQPIAITKVRIEVTELGEDAGLLGAAKLALDSRAFA